MLYTPSCLAYLDVWFVLTIFTFGVCTHLLLLTTIFIRRKFGLCSYDFLRSVCMQLFPLITIFYSPEKNMLQLKISASGTCSHPLHPSKSKNRPTHIQRIPSNSSRDYRNQSDRAHERAVNPPVRSRRRTGIPVRLNNPRMISKKPMILIGQIKSSEIENQIGVQLSGCRREHRRVCPVIAL